MDSPPDSADVPVSHVTVHGPAQIGDHNRQHNTWILNAPRILWVSLVLLIASGLTVGGGRLYFGWFAKEFAPNYRTQFLIDTAEAGDATGLSAITTALRKTLGNSADKDELALRTFGGECGDSGNTAQLVGFSAGAQQKISAAAAAIRPHGRPTLLRGIVEAVDAFSRPLQSKARQVNRIIVVTRHGTDACDDDTAFVQQEIRDRISAAGLTLDFRLVGYRVPGAERTRLDQIATAVKAPPPSYAKSPAELDRTLDSLANVDPVLRGAQRIIDTLNGTVTQVNTAVQSTVDGRLDVADSTLKKAGTAVTRTSEEYDDLTGRAKSPHARDVHERAVRLRDMQRQVVAAASALLRTARDGRPLDTDLSAFRRAADDYNREVNAMNSVLATLRSRLTKKP